MIYIILFDKQFVTYCVDLEPRELTGFCLEFHLVFVPCLLFFSVFVQFHFVIIVMLTILFVFEVPGI